MNLSTIKIAWRNLGRNKRRTAVAICAIALGQLTLIFVNCMMAGMFDDILKTVTGPLVGHVQIQHGEWQEKQRVDLYVDDYKSLKAKLEKDGKIKNFAPRVFGGVLVIPGKKSKEPAEAEAGMVIGVDINAEMNNRGILATLKEDKLPGPGQVVMGQVIARRLGIKAGDSIAVIGVDVDEYPTDALFEVAAIIRGATDIVNRMGLVMSLEDAWEFMAMDNAVHQIVLQGEDIKESDNLATYIQSNMLSKETTALSWEEAVPFFKIMISMKDYMDSIFLVVVLLAAIAGIANTMMMSTFERTRELGMMLAIGTEPKRVVSMVMVEAIILGLLGIIIGTVVGTGLVLWTGSVGIDYAALSGIDASTSDFAFKGLNFSYVIYPKFEIEHVYFGALGVMVTSIIAAVWPSIIAARLEPVEAMRS